MKTNTTKKSTSQTLSAKNYISSRSKTPVLKLEWPKPPRTRKTKTDDLKTGYFSSISLITQ